MKIRRSTEREKISTDSVGLMWHHVRIYSRIFTFAIFICMMGATGASAVDVDYNTNADSYSLWVFNESKPRLPTKWHPWKYDKKPAGAGTWLVHFKYGFVSGMSSCNEKTGEYAKSFEDANNMKKSVTGKYCWCKLDKVDNNTEQNAKWVFHYDGYDLDGCAKFCPFQCAYDFAFDNVFRQAVYTSGTQNTTVASNSATQDATASSENRTITIMVVNSKFDSNLLPAEVKIEELADKNCTAQFSNDDEEPAAGCRIPDVPAGAYTMTVQLGPCPTKTIKIEPNKNDYKVDMECENPVIAIDGIEVTAPRPAGSEQANTDNSDTTVQQVSKPKKEVDTDKLSEKYLAAKETEQSLANRTLGATSMAATGAGLMATMSAASEKRADESAENDMRAYLATFTCDWGGGQTVRGGETGVELPGANALFGLYNEYATLANSLKERKTALNIRPGIESEVVIDKASAGLYDDVGTGKNGGVYASIARALLDPNGEDAARWQEQKDASAKKLKIGATAAVAGVAVGAIGNMIINRPKRETPKKALDNLETRIAALEAQTATCPSGSTGTPPFCITSSDNTEYNPNTNSTEPVNSSPKESENAEVSASSSDSNAGQQPPNTANGANSPTTTTITQQYTRVQDNVQLDTSKMFTIGKSDLTDEAKKTIAQFYNDLSREQYQDCKITLTGYTDPIGNESKNMKLSQERANAVKTELESLSNDGKTPTLTITTTGRGEANCTCSVIDFKTLDGTTTNITMSDYSHKSSDPNWNDYSVCNNKQANTVVSGDSRYAPCRRITVSADCTKESSETTKQTE